MEYVLFAIANWINKFQEIVPPGQQRKLVTLLKGEITRKFSIYKILTKIPTRFRENFDFRGFIVTQKRYLMIALKKTNHSKNHKEIIRKSLRQMVMSLRLIVTSSIHIELSINL